MRGCDDPTPLFGGQDCQGNSSEKSSSTCYGDDCCPGEKFVPPALPPWHDDLVTVRHLGLPGLLQEVRWGQSGAEILQGNSHSLPLCRILCLSQLLLGWTQLRVYLSCHSLIA